MGYTFHSTVSTKLPRFIALATLLVAASCVDSAGPTVFLEITAPGNPIEVGFSDSCAATVSTPAGELLPSASVAWSVDDTLIAVVEQPCLVIGRGPGRTTLRARVNGARDSVTITVWPAAVSAIDITVPDSTMGEGDSVQLSASARDRAGRVLQRTLLWSAACCVVVTQAGMARAVSSGAAIITVSTPGAVAQTTLHVERRYVEVSLAGNSDHTCVRSDRGSLYCWGFNLFGQVGNGSTASTNAPFRVLSDVELFAVGANHTCAVTVSRLLACWGINQWGELGQPSTGPHSCAWNAGTMPCSTIPVYRTVPFSLVSLTAGESFTCGLTSVGQGVCWGGNYASQLGDLTTQSRPQADTIAGSVRFVTLSAGGHHACGLDADGQPWCWGHNGFLESGQASGASFSQPTMVPTALRFREISAGDSFTCGVTLDDAAYCWGYNGTGTLGDGGGAATAIPQLVPSGRSWASIAAGTFHACGLTTTNEVWCWGWLPGTYSQISLLTQVPGLFKTVRSGASAACGVGLDDLVYCWGNYTGAGVSNGSLTPQRVAGQYTLPGASAP